MQAYVPEGAHPGASAYPAPAEDTVAVPPVEVLAAPAEDTVAVPPVEVLVAPPTSEASADVGRVDVVVLVPHVGNIAQRHNKYAGLILYDSLLVAKW